MECLLQYLDDIDDLVGAIGLLYEGMRRLAAALASLLVCTAAIVSGAALALSHPPVALAISVLLILRLMYSSITAPRRERLLST